VKTARSHDFGVEIWKLTNGWSCAMS
jgi:hypothetical protein